MNSLNWKTEFVYLLIRIKLERSKTLDPDHTYVQELRMQEGREYVSKVSSRYIYFKGIVLDAFVLNVVHSPSMH